jgi:hypothetical protein
LSSKSVWGLNSISHFCEACGFPAELCDDNVLYPCEGSQARKSLEAVTALLAPHRKYFHSDMWINTKMVNESGELVPVSPPLWATVSMAFDVSFKFAPGQAVAFIGSQTNGTVTRLLVAEDGKKLVEVRHPATAYEHNPVAMKFAPAGQTMAINFYPEEQLCEVRA